VKFEVIISVLLYFLENFFFAMNFNWKFKLFD
jgi:hypothetical protein